MEFRRVLFRSRPAPPLRPYTSAGPVAPARLAALHDLIGHFVDGFLGNAHDFVDIFSRGYQGRRKTQNIIARHGPSDHVERKAGGGALGPDLQWGLESPAFFRPAHEFPRGKHPPPATPTP